MRQFLLSITLFVNTTTLLAQGPAFEWAGEITGERKINSYAIKVDDQGSVLTLGYFVGSIDVDPGPSVFILENPEFSYPDIFVQKLDSSGNFLWAAQFGGPLGDGAWVLQGPPFGGNTSQLAGALEVDAEGNVFVVARFMSDSIDADPGSGTSYIHRLTPYDYWTADYLVIKLDTDGNYLWAHAFGGKGDEKIGDADVDTDGNLYVVGSFRDSVDFDPSSTSSFWLVADDVETSFIQKLNNDGDLVWVKKMESGESYTGNDFVIGADGLLYITGVLTDTFDFDLGPGVFELTEYVDTVPLRIYILKLDSDGEFVWAGQLPGGASSSLIAVNSDGEMAITSSFHEDVIDIDPSPNGEVLLYDTAINHVGRYIVKLSAQGEFLYGYHTDLLLKCDFDFDGQGGLMVAAYIIDTLDMAPGPDTVIVALPSAEFPFDYPAILSVCRLKEDLTLDWFRIMGSTFPLSENLDMAIDIEDNIYITSGFRETPELDLNPSPSDIYHPPFGGSFYGDYDVFVLKWSQPGLLVDVAYETKLSGFDAYPNPSSGRFTIDLGQVHENVDYSIIDPMGRTVQTGRQSFTRHLVIEMDAPPGMYLCVLNVDSNTSTLPVIIQ